MIETTVSCDYRGYCTETGVSLGALNGWYAIYSTETEEGFEIHIDPLCESRPPKADELLGCCEMHAGFLAHKLADGWLHEREEMHKKQPGPVFLPKVQPPEPQPPETTAPDVQDKPEEGLPF